MLGQLFILYLVGIRFVYEIVMNCLLFLNYISYLLWFGTLRRDHSGWEI